MKFCPVCSSIVGDEDSRCPQCQADLSAGIPKAEYPMKWFKFLIYFSLFAGALLNLSNGINYITGNIYMIEINVSAEIVYGFWWQGLKTADIIYGALMIASAVVAVVARFKLAKFKEDGPKFLYATYAIDMVSPVLYYVLARMLTGHQEIFSEWVPTLMVGIVGSTIMLWTNYRYFSKRDELFDK